MKTLDPRPPVPPAGAVPVLVSLAPLVALLLLSLLLAPAAVGQTSGGSGAPSEVTTETPSSETPSPEAVGDAAWARRGEGAPAPGVAAPGPVGEAVAAYSRAVEAAPEDLGVHVKLLEALMFRGEFATAEREAKQEAFDRGRQAARRAIDRVLARAGLSREAFEDVLDDDGPEAAARRVASVDEAAAVFYWAAVLEGLWGDVYGRLAAARAGVGDTVREYSKLAIALEPGLDDAGPHRVLGRLHTLAPKVPFVTGWVDRDVAFRELETARRLAPGEALNLLYLAEALIEHGPRQRRSEARRLLEEILARPIDPDEPVADAATHQDARELLASLGDGR